MGAGDLDRIAAGEGFGFAYQPIFDLVDRSVVAFEALCRPHPDSGFASAAEILDAARDVGRVAEVDWAFRAMAIKGGLDAGLAPPWKLFVNVEPDGRMADPPQRWRSIVEEATRQFEVVVEFTERDVISNAAAVLSMVDRTRTLGAGVALDDAGDHPGSLALMPFINPDVLKIAKGQERVEKLDPTVISAVFALLEATGAELVIERIETEAEVDLAMGFGARFGQGFLLGRPGSLDLSVLESPQGRVPITLRPLSPRAPSALGLLASQRPVHRAHPNVLVRVMRSFCADAQRLGRFAVAVGASPEVLREFDLRGQLAAMAGDVTLAALISGAVSDSPSPLTEAAFRVDDPLRDELVLAVTAPHYGAAVCARRVGEGELLEYATTHDPALVTQVASVLIARLGPQ